MLLLSFSDAEGQATKHKATRREKFLNQMEELLLWKELERAITANHCIAESLIPCP